MITEFLEIDLGCSPIPDGCFRNYQEVTIRRDGHIWRIHRSDLDPFPSKPHAHNIESGLKLDLSTGRLYFGTRDTGKSIANNHLAVIRSSAEQAGIILPPLID